MRGFFAKGVKKMHIPWAVEGLPTLLHLSLFLFFGGLVIFLFNINQEVFTYVVCWIGVFSMVYVLITVLPLIRLHSPYYTPLSILAQLPYAGILYATFKVLASVTSHYDRHFFTSWHYRNLRDRYRGWMLGGVEVIAEEMALDQSLDIDVGILDWTIGALGDDDSLEKFFEAVPGFFNSKVVKDLREDLPDDTSTRLSDTLDRFLIGTLTSNSVIDSVKRHRLDITLSAMNFIHDSDVWSILATILIYWDQVPQTVEIGHTVARWCTSSDRLTPRYAHLMVAKALATSRERNDRWVSLAARVYGLPEGDVWEIVSHGDDSVSLAILIHLTRAIGMDSLWDEVLTEFDIHNTLSGLQHDFCTLWNEIVQEAKNQEPSSLVSDSVYTLRRIRHHYIALHQGTDAAPTAFSPSTDSFDSILREPLSYPLCDIASHRPDSIPHLPLPTQPAHSPNASPRHSTSGGSTLSRQVSVIAGTPSPSHPTKTSEIRGSSQAAAATSPALSVRTSPRHPPEGTTPRDIVAPCAEPDISENLSTTSTPTPAPVSASTPPVLNESLESYDAGAASPSIPLLPAPSVVGFSNSASLPPSRVPSPNAGSFALFSNTTLSRPTGNVTLPRLRARGLVNTGSMCFTNAVLQLLVHSPPFWNLIKELGGAGGLETSSDGTPLVDATVRFFKEFMLREKEPPPTQQPLQQAGENKEEKKESKVVNSFEPTYMYDAMRVKRQLKILLVRFRAT
jgi:hypothetical protein